MEVFACLAGTDVRVPVEADHDETVSSLRDKAVRCLCPEGHVSGDVLLRLAGSGEGLGGDGTLLQHTPLEAGATVELVVIQRDTFGADKGVAFDDGVETTSWGRVVHIAVAVCMALPTAVKLGLALTYANGRRVTHGNLKFLTKRTQDIPLDEDEHVTGVRGWCVAVSWQSITFITNKRELGPFGAPTREGNRTAFSTDFGAGNELMYVKGRVSNNSVTQIGFAYGRPVDVPRVRRTALHHVHDNVSGWSLDDDGAEGVHLRARICGVCVTVSDFDDSDPGLVSGLGVAYTDGTYFRHSQTFSVNVNSQKGVRLNTVALGSDEFITGVETRMNWNTSDYPVAQVGFTTNKRTIGPFGSQSGERFADTFDGELLFVSSESRWLRVLGFGHGPPATGVSRTMTEQQMLQSMRQVEEEVRRASKEQRSVSLLDYLSETGTGQLQPIPVPEAKDSGCGCAVC